MSRSLLTALLALALGCGPAVVTAPPKADPRDTMPATERVRSLQDPEPVPTPAPPVVVPGKRNGARRVLVVDDDFENARVTAEVLTEEGYDVKVANDGAAARAIWTAGPFDAALLDAVMPDVSGWELAAFLREKHPEASLAVVTGADVRGIKKEELARVDAVFRKPVEAGVLDEFLSGDHP